MVVSGALMVSDCGPHPHGILLLQQRSVIGVGREGKEARPNPPTGLSLASPSLCASSPG